jgi:hypothetical protein
VGLDGSRRLVVPALATSVGQHAGEAPLPLWAHAPARHLSHPVDHDVRPLEALEAANPRRSKSAADLRFVARPGNPDVEAAEIVGVLQGRGRGGDVERYNDR